MTAAEWAPEFPGQRPPFPPGNTLAVKSGARSERMVAPLARQLVERTLSDPDVAYLNAARYGAEVDAWSRAEARVKLLQRYLDERAPDGVGDPKELRNVWDELHRAETRAAKSRDALGLTPSSAARLGRNVAAAQVDWAALYAQQEAAQRVEQAAQEAEQ